MRASSSTCVNVDAFAQVIDARDPLTYRSSDLEDYAHSISRHKGSMLLLNKSDLLPEVMLLLIVFQIAAVWSAALFALIMQDSSCNRFYGVSYRLHASHGRTTSTARASPTSSGRPSWRLRWQTMKQVLTRADVGAVRAQ